RALNSLRTGCRSQLASGNASVAKPLTLSMLLSGLSPKSRRRCKLEASWRVVGSDESDRNGSTVTDRLSRLSCSGGCTHHHVRRVASVNGAVSAEAQIQRRKMNAWRSRARQRTIAELDAGNTSKTRTGRLMFLTR